MYSPSFMITLPGEAVPYAERATVNRSTGRIFSRRDPSLIRFQARLAHAAGVVMADEKPIAGPVSISIVLYRAIPASLPAQLKRLAEKEHLPCWTKPDLDNLSKAICDPLKGIAITDDARIASMTLHKLWSPKPRLHVIVQSLLTRRILDAMPDGTRRKLGMLAS